MKNLLFLLIALLNTSLLIAQKASKLKDVEAFQKHLNAEFANPEESPLTLEDIKKFEALEFFDIDTAYVIEAEFVRTPYESPFSMPTTTDRKPIYVKYGEAYFDLEGQSFKLNIYQNQELITKAEYVDYLFIPFTDATNGETSYGGGRYLDLRIPTGKTITLNFNKAYNPYCAYNGKYSCPIPPSENDISIGIPVGVKAYKK
ncbi:hypothetical protein BC962_2747 [Gillisia mitskevichiae]|uniref:DUF1684 domain-containing protein n=1 Tax=Gillisia mitskevichiae TaxID=270921 RepID=A0A495P785_9FLAO|nr:DUF1684 domain-containing protein [Gillisia mitskevichiae]RKS45072.1 hypothetical protein BC962_2747 [Gillisia mitskevichiae]